MINHAVIVFIALTTLITETENTSLKTKISASSGAYFEPNKFSKAYEKTIPILYSLKIPRRQNVETPEWLEEINKLQSCVSQENIWCIQRSKNILRILDLIMEIQQINEAIIKEFDREPSKRTKRGIQMLGDFDTWCCNVMILAQGNDFIENEKNLKTQYERLRESVIENHAELLNVTKDIKNFEKIEFDNSKILRENVQALKEAIQNQNNEIIIEARRELIFDTARTLHASLVTENAKLSHLFLSCKNNHLPAAIINETTLKEDLMKIKKLAEKSNFAVVLDEKSIQSYYRTKLVNCYVTGNEIEIELKIPLQNLHAKYELYNVIPLAFRTHDDKICFWDQEPSILSHNKFDGSIRIITGTDIDLCGKNSLLCFLPQDRTINNKGNCARALFQGMKYEEIIKKCTFKCETNHNEIIVKQIEMNQFAITNAKNPLISVNTITKTSTSIAINDSWPGATLLTVPCIMEIQQLQGENNAETIIPAGFPCINDPEKEILMEHHLPLVWTKYQFMELDFGLRQSFKFPNISIAYNNKWHDNVPYISPITPIHKFEERLKTAELKIPDLGYQDTINTVHLLLLGWCGLLTFAVAILIYVNLKVNCVAINAHNQINDLALGAIHR